MNLTESLNWRYATKRMTGEKISEEDLNLYRIVDNADDAVAHIKAFYEKYAISVNF